MALATRLLSLLISIEFGDPTTRFTGMSEGLRPLSITWEDTNENQPGGEVPRGEVLGRYSGKARTKLSGVLSWGRQRPATVYAFPWATPPNLSVHAFYLDCLMLWSTALSRVGDTVWYKVPTISHSVSIDYVFWPRPQVNKNKCARLHLKTPGSVAPQVDSWLPVAACEIPCVRLQCWEGFALLHKGSSDLWIVRWSVCY
jgi:hypothetical protein